MNGGMMWYEWAFAFGLCQYPLAVADTARPFFLALSSPISFMDRTVLLCACL